MGGATWSRLGYTLDLLGAAASVLDAAHACLRRRMLYLFLADSEVRLGKCRCTMSLQFRPFLDTSSSSLASYRVDLVSHSRLRPSGFQRHTSSAVQGLLSIRGSRQSYQRFQHLRAQESQCKCRLNSTRSRKLGTHWSPLRVPTASAILLQRVPYSSTASRSLSSSSLIHVPFRMVLAML